MTDIMAISKDGVVFYPQTHYLAVLGLTEYIKSLIPDQIDASLFITSDSMSDYVLSQLKSYALVNDIPDVSQFIKAVDLTGYALKTDIPSLTGYAKLTDIPQVDLSKYALKTDIPDTVDLSDYATQKYVNDQIDAASDKVDVSAISTNTQPATYVKNYAGSIHKEVKQLDSIGITSDMLPTDITSTYCIVTSDIPPSSDYGYPVQVARLTQSSRPVSLKRVGATDTTWSDWELDTTW